MSEEIDAQDITEIDVEVKGAAEKFAVPYDDELKREDRKKLVRLDVAIAAQYLFAGRVFYNETPSWAGRYFAKKGRILEGIGGILVSLRFGPIARTAYEAIMAQGDVQLAEEAARRIRDAAEIVVRDLRANAMQPGRKARHRDDVLSRHPKGRHG